MSQEHAWQELDQNFLSNIVVFAEKVFAAVINYTVETVEHLILFSLFYLALCLLIYACIVQWEILTFQRQILNPRRVLLIIAHPDDECMFFGPTILNLLKDEKCVVYLLCLSIGANYGMGKIRKNELYEACKVLGIQEENIIINSHTLLPDEMGVNWPIDLVSQIVSQQVEMYDINTLISFDRHGISKHSNHCSIYYAIASLCMNKQLPTDCKVFVLETTSLLRKYWFILDIPLSFILSRTRYILHRNEKLELTNAMRLHKSQYLWFRKLYFYFSRYVWINTLQEMDVLDIELDLEDDD